MKSRFTSAIFFTMVFVGLIGAQVEAQDPKAPADSSYTRASVLERIDKEIQAIDQRLATLEKETAELRAYRAYMQGQKNLATSIRDSVLTFEKQK